MKKLLCGALCAGVLGAMSVQADDGVVRVIDRGRDGDTNFYQVMCTSGARATVTVTDSPAQACTQGLDGKQRCSAKWTIREAAAQACK